MATKRKTAKKSSAKRAPAKKSAPKKPPAKRTSAKATARKTAPKAKKSAPKKLAPRAAAAKKAKAPAPKTRPAPAKVAPAKAASWTERFCWHDLMTTNVEGSLTFYTKVFGWKSKAMDMGPMGTYHMLSAGGVDFGGVVGESNIPSSHWMGYVAVKDIDDVCRRTEGLGGTVCVQPFQIPNVGRFAVIADPTGGTFSPIQLDQPPQRDPNAPPALGLVAWNELVTPDPDRAGPFYEKLLGWKDSPMDMAPMGMTGTYHMFKVGGADAGGMMKTPPNAPAGTSSWLAYVHVKDVDATTKKATAAGASVGMPPFDVAGVGRLAILADPQGAMIALLSPR